MALKAKLDAFKADFEAGKPPYNTPRSVVETQAGLPQLKALGASLVAVSPQIASNSRKSVRQNDQAFPVLNDGGNDVAAAFGIRYRCRTTPTALKPNCFSPR